MPNARLRPQIIAGSLRDRLGSRRRRGYAAWGPMPERPSAGSDWWVEDPRWFPAGTPPRPSNRVAMLIDGEETFRAAWTAIQQAKHSVWLVDWALSVNMALVRGEDVESTP